MAIIKEIGGNEEENSQNINVDGGRQDVQTVFVAPRDFLNQIDLLQLQPAPTSIVLLRNSTIAHVWRVHFLAPVRTTILWILPRAVLLCDIRDLASGCWVSLIRNSHYMFEATLHSPVIRFAADNANLIVDFLRFLPVTHPTKLLALLVNVNAVVWRLNIWDLVSEVSAVFHRYLIRFTASGNSVNAIGLRQLLPARDATILTVHRHRVAPFEVVRAAGERRVGLRVVLPVEPPLTMHRRELRDAFIRLWVRFFHRAL